MKFLSILLGFTGLLFSCSSPEPTYVLEVTTFNLKSAANSSAFRQLDTEVERNFTSQQPGFIKRQSGVNDQGEYVVLVYWNTLENAEASMNKFMENESVADFASMIEGSTMKMSRYNVNGLLDTSESNFVEVMTYQSKADTDEKALTQADQAVATGFTAKQNGFIKRITGVNESGEHVITVYWDNKANSDAALQPFMEHHSSKVLMGMMDGSTTRMGRYQTLTSLDPQTSISNKDKVIALLNSFNTGNQSPIGFINPEKYIQHNLAVGDGLAGFGEVMQNAPPQGFSTRIVRAFQDGDHVFAHTEYDFFGPKAAFDVFRFEEGLIVEHWDNLIEVQPLNPSGRSQFDGTTVLKDLDQTAANKAIITGFIEEVLLKGKMDKVTAYINPEQYLQHNPAVADGLDGFGAAMQYFAENGLVMEYTKLHKVLGQGNFVLAMSEGKFGAGEATAFYDLFRLENGLIVEHWDVIQPIPANSEWKNKNGKF